jgi:biotin carboxyl carrier protein
VGSRQYDRDIAGLTREDGRPEMKVIDMDTETERRHAAAETVRQQEERRRQAAEAARNAAETSREAAEAARRAIASEVHGTVTTLTTLVARMETVEALRREARKLEP